VTAKHPKFLNKLKKKPLLPLFFNEDLVVCHNIVDACLANGLEVVEFVDRGASSKKNFSIIKKSLKTDGNIQFGVGSVKTVEDAIEFIDLGADFIVSPFMDKKVGRLCKKNQVPWVPGCGTLSEMIKAVKYGAELVKLFPGSVYGPNFISSVLAPCPSLRIMPTGGVTTEIGNIKRWMNAGAYCLGMGSKLFPKELVSSKHSDRLKNHIGDVMKKLESIR
tara:strand:- start:493 stop:1152 length:660 start_codon:yes stop_codon:yes gene_type:complete